MSYFVRLHVCKYLYYCSFVCSAKSYSCLDIEMVAKMTVELDDNDDDDDDDKWHFHGASCHLILFLTT